MTSEVDGLSSSSSMAEFSPIDGWSDNSRFLRKAMTPLGGREPFLSLPPPMTPPPVLSPSTLSASSVAARSLLLSEQRCASPDPDLILDSAEVYRRLSSVRSTLNRSGDLEEQALMDKVYQNYGYNYDKVFKEMESMPEERGRKEGLAQTRQLAQVRAEARTRARRRKEAAEAKHSSDQKALADAQNRELLARVMGPAGCGTLVYSSTPDEGDQVSWPTAVGDAHRLAILPPEKAPPGPRGGRRGGGCASSASRDPALDGSANRRPRAGGALQAAAGAKVHPAAKFAYLQQQHSTRPLRAKVPGRPRQLGGALVDLSSARSRGGSAGGIARGRSPSPSNVLRPRDLSTQTAEHRLYYGPAVTARGVPKWTPLRHGRHQPPRLPQAPPPREGSNFPVPLFDGPSFGLSPEPSVGPGAGPGAGPAGGATWASPVEEDLGDLSSVSSGISFASSFSVLSTSSRAVHPGRHQNQDAPFQALVSDLSSPPLFAGHSSKRALQESFASPLGKVHPLRRRLQLQPATGRSLIGGGLGGT